MRGSAPGERRGGRKKGAPNKASAAKAAAIEASGLTPLDYMLAVMRADIDPQMRFEAAKAAAPYVHPKLASVAHTGPDGEGPVQVEDVSLLELARRIAFIFTAAAHEAAKD